MKVATILFTYHRSNHTKKVIDGLKKNYVLPEKLFVFQDGLKDGEDRTEWDRVNTLIHGIDFCPTELIVSEKNRGLANSVIAGVNYVFQEYDAVIILEDDCVPSKNFINFMMQCFEKYKDEKGIYNISGYAWPIDLSSNDKSDIYFTGRTSSLGWGTWKDRWEQYERENDILRKISNDKQASIYLASWGSDLSGMFLAQVDGKIDSWSVYWSLKVIEKRGLCVSPYRSLIQNIGFDGTGTHSGITNDFSVSIEKFEKRVYKFPIRSTILLETQKAFAALYGSYTVLQEDDSRLHVLVYGSGRCFRKYEKALNKKFYIEAFVERINVIKFLLCWPI